MRIMHIALGGCLSRTPRYGLTEDTGGHIAYLLGGSEAQAKAAGIEQVTLVTRAFDAPHLGREHAMEDEEVGRRRRIIRLRSRRSDYFEKAELAAELPSLEDAFLRRLAVDAKPDIIHAHFADAAVLAIAAKHRFGIPWVFHAHSLGLGKAGADADRIARERTAIREADIIVASSRDEAERQLEAYGIEVGGKTFRINPGVTLPSRGKPKRAASLLAPWLRDMDKPIVLSIARPVEKKNLLTLVETFGRTPALREKANLVVLAGLRHGLRQDGSECSRVIADLFDAVDRHDLWGQVALPARHDARDVCDLYALAAKGGVFVNPALHEPFGLTILEAVRSGVPVAATDEGGPADILRDVGYGRSFQADDKAALAAAVRELLNDPIRQPRARRASDRCRALYSWDRWAEDILSVWRARLATTALQQPAPRRLLVSDMDDTLTGDRNAATTLSNALALQTDIELVVATGRPVTEARRVLREWGIKEPRCIIASVGSEIWLKTAGDTFCLDRNFARRIGKNWDRSAVQEVLQVAGFREQVACEQRHWKLSFFGDVEDAVRLGRVLEKNGLFAKVIPSHGRFIDVLPKRAGKAAAAEHVARLFALDRTSCVAAGNSGNDRDLLLWAARAVLPRNALSELDDLCGPRFYRSSRAYAGAILDALDMSENAINAPVAAE